MLQVPVTLKGWEVSHLLLLKCHAVVARKWGVTLIFKQLESGDWNVTKMKFGQILNEVTVPQTPVCMQPYVHNTTRYRRRET